MTINDNYEAFDHAIAFYNWLAHNHNGQWSDEYKAISKLIDDYKLNNCPDLNVDSYCDDDENINAIELYKELDENNWLAKFNVFCDYMDNQWDKE